VTIRFVVVEHFRLALDAMLLFAVGLFLAWPAVRYNLRWVLALPIWVLRNVVRVMGPQPSLVRTAGVIFSFNAVAIFIYMASGYWALLPKVFGIWTGMNVAIMAAIAGQGTGSIRFFVPSGTQWVPPRGMGAACGLIVIMLELPCFWYAVAMGMSLGSRSEGGMPAYLAELKIRSLAYCKLIVPLLLVSAAAEAVAIRGTGSGLADQESSPD